MKVRMAELGIPETDMPVHPQEGSLHCTAPIKWFRFDPKPHKSYQKYSIVLGQASLLHRCISPHSDALPMPEDAQSPTTDQNSTQLETTPSLAHTEKCSLCTALCKPPFLINEWWGPFNWINCECWSRDELSVESTSTGCSHSTACHSLLSGVSKPWERREARSRSQGLPWWDPQELLQHHLSPAGSPQHIQEVLWMQKNISLQMVCEDIPFSNQDSRVLEKGSCSCTPLTKSLTLHRGYINQLWQPDLSFHNCH